MLHIFGKPSGACDNSRDAEAGSLDADASKRFAPYRWNDDDVYLRIEFLRANPAEEGSIAAGELRFQFICILVIA